MSVMESEIIYVSVIESKIIYVTVMKSKIIYVCLWVNQHFCLFVELSCVNRVAVDVMLPILHLELKQFESLERLLQVGHCGGDHYQYGLYGYLQYGFDGCESQCLCVFHYEQRYLLSLGLLSYSFPLDEVESDEQDQENEGLDWDDRQSAMSNFSVQYYAMANFSVQYDAMSNFSVQYEALSHFYPLDGVVHCLQIQYVEVFSLFVQYDQLYRLCAQDDKRYLYAQDDGHVFFYMNQLHFFRNEDLQMEKRLMIGYLGQCHFLRSISAQVHSLFLAHNNSCLHTNNHYQYSTSTHTHAWD